MRLAVLADVHGNLPALDAVLAEIAREEFDLVVCAGDVVSGPMPRESLARLLEIRAASRHVRGNADRLVVQAWDALRGRGAPPADLDPWDRFAAERLTADERDALATFEPVVDLGDMLICHGTPADDEGIVTAQTPLARLEDVLAGIDASLVVGGHVHHQFALASERARWLNAGSVGMPYEGRPGAFWLEVLDGEPRHRRTAYDVETTVAACRDLPLAAETGLPAILRGAVTAEQAAAALEPASDSRHEPPSRS